MVLSRTFLYLAVALFSVVIAVHYAATTRQTQPIFPVRLRTHSGCKIKDSAVGETLLVLPLGPKETKDVALYLPPYSIQRDYFI